CARDSSWFIKNYALDSW
nr:immunoglobulin heavy chain junction region [Macaca mulatta]MOV47432.1 immunoglobulin heavy chain junction region [Macaca mulatta]MOV47473.1 immunoglobulin heavy chain junction region [Macaca mulatta]MOV47750.1 immunoglobulin heavy chain junction region [Macaca mulatta]MOV47894.1 immunoglobulin heavy chain junction region [Macaca mulatta]